MGHKHDITAQLTYRAQKIANRERKRLAQRGLVAVPIESRAGSNVVELRPSEHHEIAATTTLPSPPAAPAITTNAHELLGEATLTDHLHAALIDGIGEMRAILNDPRTPDVRKERVFAQLVKAKQDISRSQLRSHREAARQIDWLEMDPQDRQHADNHRRVQALIAAGYEIRLPTGEVVKGRSRTSLDVDDSD